MILKGLSYEIFKKDSEERKMLKRVKYKKKFESTGIKIDNNTLKGRLVIYMRYSNVPNFKSTHSFMCFKNDIPNIVGSLRQEGYRVKNVFFNNKKVHYV